MVSLLLKDNVRCLKWMTRASAAWFKGGTRTEHSRAERSFASDSSECTASQRADETGSGSPLELSAKSQEAATLLSSIALRGTVGGAAPQLAQGDAAEDECEPGIRIGGWLLVQERYSQQEGNDRNAIIDEGHERGTGGDYEL